jgi:hypothetical protein
MPSCYVINNSDPALGRVSDNLIIATVPPLFVEVCISDEQVLKHLMVWELDYRVCFPDGRGGVARIRITVKR